MQWLQSCQQYHYHSTLVGLWIFLFLLYNRDSCIEHQPNSPTIFIDSRRFLFQYTAISMAQHHPALLWASDIWLKSRDVATLVGYNNIYCLLCSAINWQWSHIPTASLQAWWPMPIGKWHRCLWISIRIACTITEYTPMITRHLYTDWAFLTTELIQLSVLTICTTPLRDP